MIAQRIIEGTILAIVLGWVLTHATEFSAVANSTANVVVGSVRALQGRTG